MLLCVGNLYFVFLLCLYIGKLHGYHINETFYSFLPEMFKLSLFQAVTWEGGAIEALSQKTAGNLTKARAAYFLANVKMHSVSWRNEDSKQRENGKQM